MEAKLPSTPPPKKKFFLKLLVLKSFFVYSFCGLDCVGHFFAYVAHFVFLRNEWIQTQKDALASRRVTNFATHLPNLATHLPNLANHLPDIATHLPELSHPSKHSFWRLYLPRILKVFCGKKIWHFFINKVEITVNSSNF
jgi:hypothetical protein